MPLDFYKQLQATNQYGKGFDQIGPQDRNLEEAMLMRL